MILVFGGTTEGRKAAATLDVAGQPFYYSTRSDAQQVEMVNGRRLTGAMDVAAMVSFCREHDVRLLVDAAHPFAEELHRNLLSVANQVGVPVIRFDRIYPPHTDDITWCSDYDDAMRQLTAQGVRRLLALTGVQTIGRLRPYWEHGECWWRILDRSVSKALAQKNGFPEDHLVYYEHDDTAALIRRLRPEAILTKESGLSGGFSEKVSAAREAGVRVFVVERPPYPPVTSDRLDVRIEHVDGPHGLRRMVERYVPGFYPLRTGLTTGAIATAAVKAATLALLGEEADEVALALPDGETITVPIDRVRVCLDAPQPYAEATATKDFSDDPDVTRGCHITARVAILNLNSKKHFNYQLSIINFLQGDGVGLVTLPGLGIPVGEPAINPVPRQMMTAEVRALTDAPVDITISVEGGRELAERTFNSRVGVVDGISIIGTSGIVSPLSNDAFIRSIGRELQVARAMGCTAVGLASGKRGETALLEREPGLRVVHYGNFIGESLRQAHELGFSRAVVGIMIGKAVKLAEGHLDTHSHKVLMNKDFLAGVARSVGVADADAVLQPVTMARELWALLPPAFFERLHDLCMQHCRTVFPTGTLEINILEQ